MQCPDCHDALDPCYTNKEFTGLYSCSCGFEGTIAKTFVEAMMDDLEPLTWYEKIYYPLSNFLDRVKSWFKEYKEYLTLGFKKRECWAFNSCHAEWVIPRLKYLKRITNSYPSCFEFVPCREDETVKAWHDALDKMIWAFENWDNNSYSYPEGYDHRYLTYIDSDGSKVLISMEENLLPDFSELEARKAKVQEGLSLFAKYYGNLWD